MQTRHISGIAILILSTIFIVADTVARHYFLYWRFWWYDIPMHLLGGFLIGAIYLWLVRFEIPISLRPKLRRFIIVFLLTLAIGVLWEIFEYVSGMTKGEPGYWFDTIHDIIDDLLGGTIAYLIFKRL